MLCLFKGKPFVKRKKYLQSAAKFLLYVLLLLLHAVLTSLHIVCYFWNYLVMMVESSVDFSAFVLESFQYVVYLIVSFICAWVSPVGPIAPGTPAVSALLLL